MAVPLHRGALLQPEVHIGVAGVPQQDGPLLPVEDGRHAPGVTGKGDGLQRDAPQVKGLPVGQREIGGGPGADEIGLGHPGVVWPHDTPGIARFHLHGVVGLYQFPVGGVQPDLVKKGSGRGVVPVAVGQDHGKRLGGEGGDKRFQISKAGARVNEGGPVPPLHQITIDLGLVHDPGGGRGQLFRFEKFHGETSFIKSNLAKGTAQSRPLRGRRPGRGPPFPSKRGDPSSQKPGPQSRSAQ